MAERRLSKPEILEVVFTMPFECAVFRLTVRAFQEFQFLGQFRTLLNDLDDDKKQVDMGVQVSRWLRR